jgi:hypothetical protein
MSMMTIPKLRTCISHPLVVNCAAPLMELAALLESYLSGFPGRLFGPKAKAERVVRRKLERLSAI